jgi:hypothetical protein
MIFMSRKTARRIIGTAVHKSEAEEQCELIAWANQCAAVGIHPELKWLHAIPNGGRRDKAEAAHLKRQGVKPGVPDLCLPVPRGRYHGLYIEMKVGKNKPTENQVEWLSALDGMGYAVAVCYSVSEGRDTIEEYLSTGKD